MTREEAIIILHGLRMNYLCDPNDCMLDKKDENNDLCKNCEEHHEALVIAIDALEKVKKSEDSFEWCTDCKEYDQDTHCCHRFTKCIHDTVEEVKKEYGIIFCEDCIHYKCWESPGGDVVDWYCDRPNQQSSQLKPTDYCSYAESKE